MNTGVVKKRTIFPGVCAVDRVGRKGWFILALWVSALSAPVQAEWYRQTDAIMGTEVAVEFWADDRVLADRVIDQIFADMRRIDALWNPDNPDSELAMINRDAVKRAVPISPETAALLGKALYYSALSDGAFDVSYASVGYLYNYREHRHPSDQSIADARPGIDYTAIKLDEKALTVRLMKPGMHLDFGGIAKGYSVDRGIAALRDAGIAAGLVSAGGDSRILGDRGDRPWSIGIRHPRKEGEFAVIIPLANTAISTSGDYERFFIEGGKRFHHIINPRTGRSVDELQSVSILAPKAIDSDALSTTVFVLGIERGLALINRLPGIDAILIDGGGRLHYSSGLMQPE